MESQVKFADAELKEAFEELEEVDPRLYKEIEKAMGDIRVNCFCGRNVKKYLIPKDLIAKFDIDNLWIYNLRADWRLIYSIANDQIEVLALVLDWMNHKDYDKLFGF